jgi:glycerophosphoryl diester phosphodiesterase
MPKAKIRFSYGDILSEVRRDFGRHLSNLLVFDIFFKIVATIILGPISAWILNRLVASSGAYVVGNEHIISFILSPTGLVTVIVSGTLLLAIVFAEQAGIILIASKSGSGRSTRAHVALLKMAAHLRSLVGLGLRQIVAFLLYLAPPTAVAGVTFYIISLNYDINFLLIEKPPVFWVGAGIVGFVGLSGLLVTGLLYIRWIFSVPLCVLAGQKPAVALRESRALVAGYFRQIAGIFLNWALLVTAAGLLMSIFWDVVGEFVLNRTGENPSTVIIIVCGLFALYGLTVAALTFIGFATHCLLVNILYHKFHAAGKPAPLPQPDSGQAFDDKAPARRKTVWGVVMLTLIATTIGSYLILDRIDLDRPVAVTAHRGSSMDAPENTLSAVRRAIKEGAGFAEIDVQETADGEVVLLHDTDLMRVAGVNKKIWQLTYPEIKSLDAGSWFSPEFKGEHIPTLSEAIEMSRNKIRLNIELKFNGHEKRLAESVVKIIRDQNFESQCIITSLNYEGLMKVESLNPALKTGFIIAKSIGDMFRIENDILSLASGIVTPDVIAAARRRNKEVHVWTVNRPDSMSYYINMGVDNIITDYPAKLISVIRARDELTDVEKFLLAAADLLKR